MACRPRLILAAIAASALLLLLRARPESTATPVYRPAAVHAPAVAICISGASRGPESLRRFTSALTAHLRPPRGYELHAFVWLQDAASELDLERLLVAGGRMALVRRGGVDGRSEAEDIASDHPPRRYGAAFLPSMTPNTLRMLHKIRAVERLREQSGTHHALVLRIRPDLELRSALELPSPYALGPRTVLCAWICDAEQLASDQLLLLPGADAARRLGSLYDPATLSHVVGLSSPPSLYPERLVHHALTPSYVLRAWPPPSGAQPTIAAARGARPLIATLLGASAERDRDPLAKLRDDFPPRPSGGGCAYPGAWTADASSDPG